MIQDVRIGPCDHKTVWVVILLLQLTAVALVAGSVFAPIWASTEKNEFGLFRCYSNCAKSNYKDQRALTCSQLDFALEFDLVSVQNTLNSGCKMFHGLELAFYAYVICAGGAVFFTGVWLVSIFTFCTRKVTYRCGLFFGICCLLSQSIGVTFWVLESNTKLNGCSSFPADGSAPELCVEDGIRLAIAAGCVYFVLLLIYAFLGKKVKNQLLFVESRMAKANSSVLPDNSTLPIKVWNKPE